jgi:hypothetical protein
VFPLRKLGRRDPSARNTFCRLGRLITIAKILFIWPSIVDAMFRPIKFAALQLLLSCAESSRLHDLSMADDAGDARIMGGKSGKGSAPEEVPQVEETTPVPVSTAPVPVSTAPQSTTRQDAPEFTDSIPESALPANMTPHQGSVLSAIHWPRCSVSGSGCCRCKAYIVDSQTWQYRERQGGSEECTNTSMWSFVKGVQSERARTQRPVPQVSGLYDCGLVGDKFNVDVECWQCKVGCYNKYKVKLGLFLGNSNGVDIVDVLQRYSVCPNGVARRCPWFCTGSHLITKSSIR